MEKLFVVHLKTSAANHFCLEPSWRHFHERIILFVDDEKINHELFFSFTSIESKKIIIISQCDIICDII